MFPRLSEPGRELWNSRFRYVLCHGPRKGGKSLAIGDKMMRNSLIAPGSETIILSRTLAKGEAGVWNNLIKPGGIVDLWRRAGLTDYVKRRKHESGPGYMPGSKVPYFKLRTSGAPSTFQLHTLAEDDKVEDKFKDMSCTQFYLVEADGFDFDVFKTLRMCMRSTTVPEEYHQGFLDVNPPPQGRKHWMYDYFIGNPRPDCTAIAFPLDKNCFLSDRQKQDIFNTYAHDKNQLDRLYYGKWIEASGDSVFAEVFNEQLCIVGEEAGSDLSYGELDGAEILRPWDGAFEIHLGWDIGDQYTSVSLATPRITDGAVCCDLLDEVCVMGRRITLSEFVAKVVSMLDYWEKWLRRENKVETPIVNHWSDNSSMTERMTLGGTEAMLISQLTEGRINLRPVTKGRGSVDDRKDMLKRLLHENRVAVSIRCNNHIQMLRNLPPRDSRVDSTDNVRITSGVDPLSRHKHAFDSYTYMLQSCLPQMITNRISGARRARSFSVDLS